MSVMTLNGDLIALLVHDLKNPLAALLSNLGFVASAVRDDEMTAEAVLDCQLSTEVLLRLIENVSAMGSLEGNTSPQSSEATVSDVLKAVERRMRRHTETSMFGLTMRCDPDVGRVGVGARHLELAVDNLIATSMAYAPSSSSIQVVARRIDEATVGVAVLDDGPPLDDEHKVKILSKGSQSEVKSARGARYGRAFGLYVVGLIAESVKGELDIGHQEGRTIFELRLPATS